MGKINIVFGVIYRHPKGNIKHFNYDLNNILSSIPTNTPCILVGDVNINLIHYERNDIHEYFTMLSSLNMSPHITVPTRLKETSTLIDHIFCRLPGNLFQSSVISGNIFSDITDHLPIFTVIKFPSFDDKSDRPFVRLYSESNIANFSSKVSECDWEHLFGDSDIDTMCGLFYNKLYDIHNACFPLVRLSRKRAKDKPWLTHGLKLCIKKKNRMYRKQLQRPTAENINGYKMYRNILTTCLSNAQKQYYNDIFSDRKNSVFNLWKCFGRTLNMKKNKSHSKLNKLIVNNTVLNDDNNIANGMNEHFCSIGEKVANNLPRATTNFKSYLRNKIDETFFIQPILEPDILKEIYKLKPKKSPGPDNISNKLIKSCAGALVLPLSIIYNKSIVSGQYPTKWKLGRVIALYKKNSHYNPENYRPISLLDCFGKIFERLIYNQMMKFIKKHSILFINQFGFREKYSTTLALIDITDKIKHHIDNNEYVMGIFLDLAKAFDTVNHRILCEKLSHYGFRGHCLSFLKSYITNRRQYTRINGCDSNVLSLEYGVPQGSVLGPLLFILYINDIQYCIDRHDIRLFADDTSIFLFNKNFDELIRQSSEKMQNIYQWFLANKLSLSFPKSNFVIFHGKNKQTKDEVREIVIDSNKVIPRQNSAKYIGLTLDSILNWEQHVQEILKSLYKYFSVFYSIRDFIDKTHIRPIYFSYIYSRIKYGIEVYGSCRKSLLNKLQVTQNKLLKVLSKKPFRYDTNLLHKENNIFKIDDSRDISILHFVHSCVYNESIQQFNGYYEPNVHNYNTRQRGNLMRRPIRTEIGRSTIHFSGATLWNDLPNHLQNITNFPAFKRELNDFFRSKY